MKEVIYIILPASISILILKKAFKDMKWIYLILLYLVNTLIINVLVNFFFFYILKYETFEFTPYFATKYLLFGGAISLLLGIILCFLIKRFSLNIEVKKNEKKSN